MKSTDTPHRQDVSPGTALLLAIERLAFPVFLFGAVFLITTTLVTLVLTPDRFPVRIGDRSVRLIDLEAEQKKLLSEKAELLSKQIAVPDSRAPVLKQLTLLRPLILPVGTVLLAVENARVHLRTDTVDPISLPHIVVAGSGSMIEIGGEVRDMAGSTIKILASFVDALRSIPSVASVSEPEYTLRKDANGTSVSPLFITITLTHAAH